MAGADGLSSICVAAVAVILLTVHRSLANPLWGPQGMGRNIRHLPCVSRKTGETGTCMFAFSCAKMNGTHLGTCIDRFYFGSCCKVPEGNSDLDLAPVVDNNNLDSDVLPVSSTTQRIRPAITQMPSSPRPPAPSWTTATTGRPPPPASSGSTVKPAISTTRLPPSESGTFGSTTEKPYPVSSSRPIVSSTNRPVSSSSRPISSSARPVSSSTPRPSTWPSSIASTSTVPTLVTWTTLEGAPSRKPPQKPQVEATSQPTATYRPTLVTASGTITTPTKRPVRPSSQTAKPTSKPKPPSSGTSKPSKPVTKPPKLGSSTPRPSSPTTKIPSTTWIPVSVSTHAPSAPTKKPSTTKKPITAAPTKPPSTATQAVVNKIEVSSTARPQVTSTVGQQSSPNFGHLSSTTNRPIVSTLSTLPPKPSSQAPPPSSVKPPPRPVTSTVRPVAEASTASQPIIISSTRPGISSTTTEASFSSSSTSWVTIDASRPPTTTTVSASSPLVTQMSTVGPTVSTTAGSKDSSTVSGDESTPLPVANEVESYNMSNYKDVCGRRLFPEARVVGGQLSAFGKWPWQISLRQWRTSTYLHKCGAALLSENWAITAAHCVENVPPSDLLLRLGEHDLSTEEEPYGFQERRVQIVASHPQFDPRTFEYDLALLRFYEPVTFQPNIIPVCVPEDDTNFVGSMAFVTGWGRLYEDGPLPSILQEVSVPVINNTICETMYRAAGYIEHIPDIFICAGWKKGGFDSCEGDSGGPMVIQRPDRRWLLAGVISWGIGCAEPNQPGVYTRISQFRHWINQILQF
ncbi:Tryp_SPc [Nesidiocoris tenuis]|uniref:Tryp_SPc n=1 Tax=Nesidiocoris tenuis TaxID=355587 RepID=A0ABN7AY16_9HEMI|nr:Tryp_SPc [Nesidiocoris tenuis]